MHGPDVLPITPASFPFWRLDPLDLPLGQFSSLTVGSRHLHADIPVEEDFNSDHCFKSKNKNKKNKRECSCGENFDSYFAEFLESLGLVTSKMVSPNSLSNDGIEDLV